MAEEQTLPGFGAVRAWTKDHTERYLSKHPLPGDFRWRGKQVVPQYQLKKGYGFWLRTTPYHRGLFEAVHQHLATCTVFPDSAALAKVLQDFEAWEAANKRTLWDDEGEG